MQSPRQVSPLLGPVYHSCKARSAAGCWRGSAGMRASLCHTSGEIDGDRLVISAGHCAVIVSVQWLALWIRFGGDIRFDGDGDPWPHGAEPGDSVKWL